jgi:transcriptional regulator with XRE-family HTH domain
MTENEWPAQMRHLALRIKRVRTGLEISQREMARILNVSPSYLSAVERGEDKPNAEILMGLALIAVDIDANWLLTGKGEPFAASKPYIDIAALRVALRMFYKALSDCRDEYSRSVAIVGQADFINAVYHTYMGNLEGLLAEGKSDEDARRTAADACESHHRHFAIG